MTVEKFQPEYVDGLYYMRAMLFVGHRVTCSRISSREPIVNASTLVHMDRVEPHPDIVKLRKEMGFDLGKFDYVMHEGVALLLDANKPPAEYPAPRARNWWRPGATAQRAFTISSFFRHGLKKSASQ